MHNINSEIFFLSYKNTFLPVDGFRIKDYLSFLPLPLLFHIRPFLFASFSIFLFFCLSIYLS